MSNKIDYFSKESLQRDLKGKAVRGGMLTGAGQIARVLIGLATIPILARLLDPADFGLVAMVAFFTNFAAMFVDSGLSMATIQRDEITHRQVSNLFWIATMLGTLVAITTAALAPAISLFYNEPRLTGITLAMACSYIFSGMTVQHQALLRRGMQFRDLAMAGVVSQLASQVAAIAWAAIHYKQPGAYWALVLMPIVMAATRMLYTWWACPWRPSRPKRGAGTRQMVVFGANLTGFNFINYFARTADQMIVGWWWGETLLGFYERARRILLQPMHKIAPAFTSVVVPTLSRLRDQPERYRAAFCAAARPLGWIGVTVVGFLYCTAEPLILLYMGPKWAQVVPVFQAFAPTAWNAMIATLGGWVYASHGHVDRQMKWGVANCIIMLTVIAAASPLGIVPLAIAISIANLLMRPLSFYICFRGTPIRNSDVPRVIWRPTVIALVSSAVSLLAVDFLWDDLARLPKLIALASIYIGTTLVLIVTVPGTIADIRKVIDLVRNRKSLEQVAKET